MIALKNMCDNKEIARLTKLIKLTEIIYKKYNKREDKNGSFELCKDYYAKECLKYKKNIVAHFTQFKINFYYNMNYISFV